MADTAQRIEGLIEPALTAMGYELVRVAVHGGESRPTLQIMAERKDGAGMTVDDCADISRTLSALLDVEDPIAGAYTLEVSSPGIDRPLVKRADFERFAGFEARIETVQPVAGRKRFRGRLMGVMGDEVRLREAAKAEGPQAAKTDGVNNETLVPLAAIARAKLVLTDELIAATQTNKRV
jgi:ribosome maturation factor RimP